MILLEYLLFSIWIAFIPQILLELASTALFAVLFLMTVIVVIWNRPAGRAAMVRGLGTIANTAGILRAMLLSQRLRTIKTGIRGEMLRDALLVAVGRMAGALSGALLVQAAMAFTSIPNAPVESEPAPHFEYDLKNDFDHFVVPVSVMG